MDSFRTLAYHFSSVARVECRLVHVGRDEAAPLDRGQPDYEIREREYARWLYLTGDPEAKAEISGYADQAAQLLRIGTAQDWWQHLFDSEASRHPLIRTSRVYYAEDQGRRNPEPDRWQATISNAGKASAVACQLATERTVATSGGTVTGTLPGGETCVNPVLKADDDRRLEHLVLDENAARIVAIARQGGSANDRMFKIIEIDRTYVGKTSVEWAELLGVSDPAIRKTPCWIRIQKRQKDD